MREAAEEITACVLKLAPMRAAKAQAIEDLFLVSDLEDAIAEPTQEHNSSMSVMQRSR